MEEAPSMDQPLPRFLTLEQVAEELNTSFAQVYALVRRGELAAIRLGGRGQWRVERLMLEKFIADLYTESAQYVRDNPLTSSDD
jgi:excisionase family DNA binding protein